MPLQPRRTWSAEDERRRRLEEDPDAYDVGPHSVTCAGCHRPIRLNATGRYYAANWNKHKMGCKNTNAVNGASAMSAESKFTGRVAAFRVAKPAEMSEPLVVSTVSGSSATRGLCRSHTQTARQSPLQSPVEDQSRLWAEQHTPRGLSAGSHYAKTPTSQSNQRIPHCVDIAYDGTPAEPFDSNNYTHTRSSIPGIVGRDGPQSYSRLDLRRPSRGPNIPSLRREEQEAYGPTNAPFREGREWNNQRSHGMPILGTQRSRQNQTPLHHSEEGVHHAAYLHSRDGLSESQRILDKGKTRYIDLNDSGPHQRVLSSRSNSYSSADLHQESIYDRHARKYARANHLYPLFRQTENSETSSPSSKSRDLSDIDSNSTASPSELGSTQLRRLQSSVKSLSSDLPPQFRSRFDDRILPPLSSLSLGMKDTHPGILQPSKSGSKDLPANTSIKPNPEASPVWRQRTREWVQSGTAWLAVDRETPESVVLPPIRSMSVPPLEVPTGTRRRQREGGELDNISMDDDRPSPSKVFVLPLDPSRSPSTLRADDLTFKYKHARLSSGEDINVGGDSIYVGKQLESHAEVSQGSKTDSARLHPVWKWEQKGNALESTGTERDGDEHEGR